MCYSAPTPHHFLVGHSVQRASDGAVGDIVESSTHYATVLLADGSLVQTEQYAREWSVAGESELFRDECTERTYTYYDENDAEIERAEYDPLKGHTVETEDETPDPHHGVMYIFDGDKELDNLLFERYSPKCS